jgi:hypothetical protein
MAKNKKKDDEGFIRFEAKTDGNCSFGVSGNFSLFDISAIVTSFCVSMHQALPDSMKEEYDKFLQSEEFLMLATEQIDVEAENKKIEDKLGSLEDKLVYKLVSEMLDRFMASMDDDDE